ncbi:MAG: hypothetical protein IKU66_05305 [Clostridia bacterium]|nr:hypothetical protein [Clostridia bacterium]
MKKITEYGLKIQQDFLDKCKQDGTYQRAYEQHEGTYVLEENIKTVQDAVAWCLLTYDTLTLGTIVEWRKSSYSAWGLPLEQLEREAQKCIKVVSI